MYWRITRGTSENIHQRLAIAIRVLVVLFLSTI
jgi:hypothetical protein